MWAPQRARFLRRGGLKLENRTAQFELFSSSRDARTPHPPHPSPLSTPPSTAAAAASAASRFFLATFSYLRRMRAALAVLLAFPAFVLGPL